MRVDFDSAANLKDGDLSTDLKAHLHDAKACSSCSSRSNWLFRIFRLAKSILNHSARSISGNSRILPDLGGHSMEKVLLLTAAPQRHIVLPTHARSFRLFAEEASGADTLHWRARPVSSRNSRLAASSGSSPGSNSPLGIDQVRRLCSPRRDLRDAPRTLPWSRGPYDTTTRPALLLGINGDPHQKQVFI